MAAVEVSSYTLAMRGKPVGTQTIKSSVAGQQTQLEAKAHFQGSIGTSTVTQQSRCLGTFASVRFREEATERSNKRHFDVDFDAKQGLVTAAKGPKDKAVIPYLVPYRDPLSLLHEIRSLGPLSAPHRVPLIGKEVVVQFAGEVELDTVFGVRNAYAYLLHPGQSVVYVAADEPHHILKMTQRLPEGRLEATIVKVTSEAAMDPFGDNKQKRSGGNRSRRRGQRRRPRRGKRT